GYQITGIEWSMSEVQISARHEGAICCPECQSSCLRSKGWYQRRVRHENWGSRRTVLLLRGRKSQCLECGHGFRQQFPGILRFQRASQAYQQAIFHQHLDGINRSRLGRREKRGAATVDRYF